MFRKLKSLEILDLILSAVTSLVLLFLKFGKIGDPTLIDIFLVIAVLGVAAGLGYRLFKSSLSRFSEEKIKTLQAILNTACEELNDKTGFVFRANIMCPKGLWIKKLSIICYSSNMSEDQDRFLTFEKWQGCSGAAWGFNQETIGDLSLDLKGGGPTWNLKDEQIRLTEHLKTIFSLPLSTPEKPKVAFILNFDTPATVQDLKIGQDKTVNRQMSIFKKAVTDILAAQDMI